MQFISEFIDEAVKGVFDTMLSMRVETLSSTEGNDMPPATTDGIVGSVGFAGKISGAVYMSYSSSLACSVVERLLGESPSDVSQPEVSDVIGELANMVAGDMKRRTAEKGYNGLLVPPIIMIGDQINMDPNGSPIAFCKTFRLPDSQDPLTIRVFAKLED